MLAGKKLTGVLLSLIIIININLFGTVEAKSVYVIADTGTWDVFSGCAGHSEPCKK